MELFTRKEIAKMLRVHERTVERWIQNGLLKAYKLGEGKTASLRILKSEVKKFLEKSKIKIKNDKAK